jgi:hypothetical protein
MQALSGPKQVEKRSLLRRRLRLKCLDLFPSFHPFLSLHTLDNEFLYSFRTASTPPVVNTSPRAAGERGTLTNGPEEAICEFFSA